MTDASTSLELVATADPEASLYEKMQSAISVCHSVDDVRLIADRAAAIAAYYKQIKDDASVRKFVEIKLRAWRRIGEMISVIDRSDCETTSAYIRKIKQMFASEEAVANMSEGAMRDALRLAAVPSGFFEEHIDYHGSASSLASAHERAKEAEWWSTPAGKAEEKRRKEHEAALKAQAEAQAKENAKMAADREAEVLAERRDLAALVALRDKAWDEVGVTLDRRDRDEMRQVLLLIKAEIHDALKQAAFDHRMTMQAILRSALSAWFVAHGYDAAGEAPKRRGRRSESGRKHDE